MALGIVSDDVFESEVKKEKIPVGEIKIQKSPGRKEDNPNTPDSIRKLIGDNALTEGRRDSIALAEALGISSHSVEAYSAGAYGSIGFERPENLISFADLKKEQVIEWVKEKLGEEAVTNVETALLNQIEEQRFPSKASGIPWN